MKDTLITLTRKDLQRFIDDAYERGFKAGKAEAKISFLTQKSVAINDVKFKGTVTAGETDERKQH